jgi:hypothetical protein
MATLLRAFRRPVDPPAAFRRATVQIRILRAQVWLPGGELIDRACRNKGL